MKKTTFLIITSAACLTLSIISIVSQILVINFGKNSKEILSAKSLWTGNTISTSKSIKNFGLYGFYINNFYSTYLKKDSFDENFLREYVNSGDIEINPNAKLFDDNLIMICLESFDLFAIDPYNTPNLWKLINEDGVYMSEFYGKNQTNVSEMISMLGFMPNYALYKADEDSLASKYSLAHLFNELGYKTNYFHSYLKSFYDREDAIESLGYDNSYFLDEADFENKSTEFYYFNLENDFFNYFKNEMIPTDGSKFFSYYMTVATHGTYNYRERFDKYFDIFDENYDKFREWFDNETEFIYPDFDYFIEKFRYFKSICIETDEMIGNLFDTLNNTEVNGTKLIDNTTVVIFADHDCYYNFFSENIKKDMKGERMYNIPFVMYSKKIEAQKIDKFCSTYDIYPTICELFGLGYNKNMCLGQNIFDEQLDTIFYSPKDNVGLFDGKYNLLHLDELSIIDDTKTETEENFMRKVNEFLEKQKVLNQIYKSNLKS